MSIMIGGIPKNKSSNTPKTEGGILKKENASDVIKEEAPKAKKKQKADTKES